MTDGTTEGTNGSADVSPTYEQVSTVLERVNIFSEVDGRPRPEAGVPKRPQVPPRERQPRSNGSRQALGAISWWIAFGPQEPGA